MRPSPFPFLAFSLCAAAATPAVAQTIGHAAPLTAADPLRLRAEPLVKRIFDGDLAAAEAVVKAGAAPGSPAATDAKAQLDGLKATFGAGGYQVERMGKLGPADVLVFGTKPGGGRAAISIRFEKTPPHRIVEIMSVTIGNGGQR